jgi:Ca2+-binding RTX toxin-like protein
VIRGSLLAVLALAALAAPAAHAATVGGVRDLAFRAAAGEENVLRVFDEGDEVRFRDRGAPLVVQGPLCRLDGTDAVCRAPRRVHVFTGDRDDRYLGPAPASLGAGDDVARGESLEGRGGDDVLTGTGRADLLLGGRGEDAISGGPEADMIDGGRGSDVIFGGSGRDEINAFDRDRDVVACGGGRDRVLATRIDVLLSCETR